MLHLFTAFRPACLPNPCALRRLLFGLFLVGAPAALLAQPDPYYLALDRAPRQALPGAATAAWHVAQVLDLRRDGAQLGTVRRGLDNLAAPALLTQPLPAAVLAYCQLQLPPRAGSRPVVFRVLELSVGENLRASSETGEAEVSGDFLELQPDSAFRLVAPAAGFVQRKGLDVTLHHPANLAQALDQALAQLVAAPATAATLPLSRADALAGRGGTLAPPLLARAPAGAGLYRTYADFLADRLSPGLRAFETVPTARSRKASMGNLDERVAYYLYLSPDQERTPLPLGEVWGLSDGRSRYIVQRGHLYPLLAGPDARTLLFVAPAAADPAGATSRAVAGAMLGGLAGAAIGAATAPSGGPATFELHLGTGRVVPAEEPGSSTFDSDAAAEGDVVYVLRRTNSLGAAPLVLSANGRPVTTLLPQQYVRLPVTAPRHELALGLQRAGVAAPSYCPVPFSHQAATYVECVAAPDASQTPTFRVLGTRTAEGYLKRLQLVQP